MDLAVFEARVREALERARDSLGRIEMEVRERGTVPELLAASRALARFCMHARDYVNHAALGRPYPRRFASNVAPLRDELAPHAELLRLHDLHPSAEDLDALVQEARTLPEKV